MSGGPKDASSFAATERVLGAIRKRTPGYPHRHAVLNRLAAHLEKRMAEASNAVLKPYGLNYVMYQALMMTFGSPGTMSPSELAEATGERRANITHLCDDLESKKLLERRPDAHDRRRLTLALTAAGERLVDELQPQMWAIWKRRYAGMGTAELEILHDLLQRQHDSLANP